MELNEIMGRVSEIHQELDEREDLTHVELLSFAEELVTLESEMVLKIRVN